MRHVAEGVLRRLVDEPLAVPDAALEHLGRCRRCQARNRRVSEDVTAARRLISRPVAVPDVDAGWSRVMGRDRASVGERAAVQGDLGARPRRWRLMGTTVGGSIAFVGGGALAVGAAAAATLTATVFAPNHVVDLPVSHADLRAFAQVLGFEAPVDGSPAGSPLPGAWAFGTIGWNGPVQPRSTSSLSVAEAATGLQASLPTSLPTGVEGPPRFLYQTATSATITFGPSAGTLDGSTLTVTAGPAVLAEYGGGSAATGLPTLAVLTMPRPTATATGATAAQLESFILGQPGFPPDLAREIRLLGNLETALPVPTPAGVSETSVAVAGAPGVLLTEPGGAASAVVWEDGSGIVRAAGGLLDQQDVLGVARQLG